MQQTDDIERRLDEALAGFSRVEPADGSVERWMAQARQPVGRRLHWPLRLAAIAAAVVLIAVLVRELSRSMPRPVPLQALSTPAAAMPRARPEARQAEKNSPKSSVRSDRQVRHWMPFPLPQPMTAEEKYALTLAESGPPAQELLAMAAAHLASDVMANGGEDLNIPDISIPPIELSPLASPMDDAATTPTKKDGNQ